MSIRRTVKDPFARAMARQALRHLATITPPVKHPRCHLCGTPTNGAIYCHAHTWAGDTP